MTTPITDRVPTAKDAERELERGQGIWLGGWWYPKSEIMDRPAFDRNGCEAKLYKEIE